MRAEKGQEQNEAKAIRDTGEGKVRSFRAKSVWSKHASWGALLARYIDFSRFAAILKVGSQCLPFAVGDR